MEDLRDELSKARKKFKDLDDGHDDLEDDLDKVKRENKELKAQNEQLNRKLKEYVSACEAQEAELKMLKQKIE